MEALIHRALILSCSKRKVPTPGLLPALNRYDGPAFRVVRAFNRAAPAQAAHLDTYVLSAKYGLIPSDCPIPDYDQKMTIERAQSLAPSIDIQLRSILTHNSYAAIYLDLGSVYMEAVQGLAATPPHGLIVLKGSGSQGGRLSRLHHWLYSETPLANGQSKRAKFIGQPKIKGVVIKCSKGAAIEIGKRALATKVGEPRNYQAWFVYIGRERVSTKWLVSQLTGLSVSEFHSADANRVLRQLGIDIYSVPGAEQK